MRWSLPVALWAALAACGPAQPTPGMAPEVLPRQAGSGQAAQRGGGKEMVGVWYTVQKGDYLSAIAQRHGVATEDLIEVNGLTHPEKLEVGQRIFLYGVDEVVRRSPQKPVTHAGSKATPVQSGRGRGRALFVWPLRTGDVAAGFRTGEPVHKGIDIKAPAKTPVYAIADGTVVYSDNKQAGYGNLIIVRHDGGIVSVYAHNRANLVDEGDAVGQGQQIAEVGSTGKSRAPHLHFEIRMKGRAVDPLVYLPAR